MKIEIYYHKTLDQNAALYFEKSKKAKKKLEGAKKALAESLEKIKRLELEKEAYLKRLEEKKILKEKPKKEWYEKFRWFFSSEGFLCLGGRDANSNEGIIKKYAEKDDLILHTDMAGSPFFVIKNGQKAGQQTIKEAAQATASYSRAWRQGLALLEVFHVKPEQVSKKTQTGEFMPKGAFMIYGKTNHINSILEIAIGIKDNKIIGGPTSAIAAQTDKYVVLVPGREKTSGCAKLIQKKFNGDLDEIISFIPAGGCEVKK